MARSFFSGNRNWRRWARIALGLSLLLHLLFFCFVELVYNPFALPETGYRVRLEPPTSYSFSEPFPSLAPSRLPIPTFSPDGVTGPGQAPSLGLGGQPEGERPGADVAGVEGLPSGELGAGEARGEKAAAFAVPAVPELDYDRLLIDKLRQEIAERAQYARFHLIDADTTDDKSRRRSRARQIVERAITAMGGREALGKIREMKVRVWVEATSYCLPGGAPVSVPPYVYPVAVWHYTMQGIFTNQHIAVKVSLDPENPNPDYVLRPPCALSSYYSLFDSRWSFSSPGAPREIPEVRQLQQAGRLREQGEAARWHFIDHFLGDGVNISYLGSERFKGRLLATNAGDRLVEVILVEDERYGQFQEALFDQETGLLLATMDGLTPQEQQWYRRAYRRDPPVWTTAYDRYQPIQGVLTPHRLVRAGIIEHLKIAYNGEEPDLSEPDVSQ